MRIYVRSKIFTQLECINLQQIISEGDKTGSFVVYLYLFNSTALNTLIDNEAQGKFQIKF